MLSDSLGKSVKTFRTLLISSDNSTKIFRPNQIKYLSAHNANIFFR